MPSVRKPLGEITPDDLQKLISDGWAEDELLEFKETLPSRGAARDPWIIDQSEVGTAAKRDVLAEVVGMANSYGGDVILGLKESEALPHRAEALTPLPKCMDLARRFEMFARDHIRPEIPLLAVRGIPTSDDDGVVIIRVPHSALAPHRLEISGTIKECYKRTRDRTEAMSMREIQDLTLDTARGIERLNRRLDELRARYEESCKHTSYRASTASGCTYAVYAAPLIGGVSVKRVHGIKEVTPAVGTSRVKFADGNIYECNAVHHNPPWNPMLRGTRSVELVYERRHVIELTTDGAYLACVNRRTEELENERKGLFVGWLFGSIINACRSIDAFRKFAGWESVEYALEIELNSFSTKHRVMGFGAGKFTEASRANFHGALRLHRYSLGPPDERTELLNLVHEDFWAALGIDAQAERIVEVNY